MSNDTQVAFKIITGILAAIGSILLAAGVNSYVDSVKENKRKLDEIYIQVITQNMRDSLQNNTIAQMRAESIAHDKETNKAIQSILMSMVRAKIQIVEADRQMEYRQKEQ